MSENYMELGLPSGQTQQQTPTWFEDFTMQSGPQRGQRGYYADQYTDIADQYMSQLQNVGQQYGQQALYDPAFLRAGNTDFSQYNPFEDQGASGSISDKGFDPNFKGWDWNYNPWQGLAGLDGAQGYLEHFTTHSDAARKNMSPNDMQFWDRYGAYLPGEDVAGFRKKKNFDKSYDQALGRANEDLNQIYGLQQQYGGY